MKFLNKMKNIFIFIFYFLVSCIKLLVNSIFALVRFKDSLADGSYLFAIFYQPFLLLILMVLFADKIDGIIYSIMLGQENIVYIIFLLIALIALTLFINAIIEFIIRIKHSDNYYEQLFSVQQHAHNYMMAIISLTAIYAALDFQNANEINTLLLVFGILIFVCIAITDLYKALFLSQNVVKDISKQFKDQYENHKQ